MARMKKVLLVLIPGMAVKAVIAREKYLFFGLWYRFYAYKDFNGIIRHMWLIETKRPDWLYPRS